MLKVRPAADVIFADSNIWLYGLLATQDTVKSTTARQIIRDARLVVSAQVIDEVCLNLLRKANFLKEEIRELIISFYERHPVHQLDKETMLQASLLRSRYRFSYWDSMMIANALAVATDVFYSEDMQSGLVVEGTLRIVNPFVSATKASR